MNDLVHEFQLFAQEGLPGCQSVSDVFQQCASLDPLLQCLLLMCGFIVSCFTLSFVGGKHVNVSWVDRLWSIAPMVYAWILALPSIASSKFMTKEVLMASLVTVWGVRLTYNFWRRGGYDLSSEDYRWEHVRAKYDKNSLIWLLFNFGFICVFQNALLLSLVVPIYVVGQSNSSIQTLDIALAVAFLAFVTLETVADNQQFAFQEAKYSLIKSGRKLTAGDFKKGFRTSGLFRYSRHPNYFCEIFLWFIMYDFTIVATGELFSASLVAPCLLALLFQGSTDLTEQITLSKYPDYAEYQKSTSRIFPLLPSKEYDSGPMRSKKQQ